MPDESERVWLVERTYSDDEQNIIILTYATLDGTNYLRKERALTSFDTMDPITASVDTTPDNLGDVHDDSVQQRYATEAQRMADTHDPDDTI